MKANHKENGLANFLAVGFVVWFVMAMAAVAIIVTAALVRCVLWAFGVM